MQYQIKKPVMSTGYKTRQRGFEPPTPWSVAKCSIQLSYQRILQISTLPIHNIVFKFQKHHLSDVSKCRRPESNRYGKLIPRDFKSRASANSATPANQLLYTTTNAARRQAKTFPASLFDSVRDGQSREMLRLHKKSGL